MLVLIRLVGVCKMSGVEVEARVWNCGPSATASPRSPYLREDGAEALEAAGLSG